MSPVLWFAWLFAGLLGAFAFSARADMGFATGAVGGTYHQVGQEIQQACLGEVKIKVHSTPGSLANIERIYLDRDVQYGFTQLDALSYFRDRTAKAVHDKIRVVFPFYPEEIHLVTKPRADIQSLADLNGRRVAVGLRSSGNWVTAKLVAQMTGTSWKPVEVSVKEGLERLDGGSVDAVVVLGGKPYPALAARGIAAEDSLRLLPLTHPKLDGLYERAEIPASLYPWQKSAVQTYAVKSVLATYDYQNATMIKDIRAMVGCVLRQLPQLQATGHPKWRDVSINDLEQIRKVWPFHEVAWGALKGVKVGN